MHIKHGLFFLNFFNILFSFKKNIGPMMVKTIDVDDSQIDTLYSEEIALR